MAYRNRFAFKLTVYKAASASDSSRVPSTTSVVVLRKQGASCQGTGSDAGTGETITVHDIGCIVAGDTIFSEDTGVSITRVVSSVTATTIVLTAGGAGTFSWSDGTRIVPTTNSPTMYTDQAGAESVASVTADSNGETEWYSQTPIGDAVITTGASITVLPDISGDAHGDWISPAMFGAVANGSTNDAGAWADMIEYAQAEDPGVVIRLAPGTHRLAATITLASLQGVVIEGCGIGVTTIQIDHAGAGLAFTSVTDVVLRNCTISRASGTAAIISVSSAATRPVFENLQFTGGGTGIADSGATDMRCRNLDFTTGTWTALITTNGTRPRVDGLVARLSANWTRAIDVDSAASLVRLADLDIAPSGAYSGIGVHIRDSQATTDPNNVMLSNCSISGGTAGNAITIDACAGVQIIGGTLYSSLDGLEVNAGISVKCIGVNFVSNVGGGAAGGAVDWNGGTHLMLIGCDFSDNYTNVSMAADQDDLTAIGNVFGDHWNASGSHGGDLVAAGGAGTEDRILILGNRGDDNGNVAYLVTNNASLYVDSSHNIAYGVGQDHGAVLAWPSVGAQGPGVQYVTGSATTLNVRGTSFLYFDSVSSPTITALQNAQQGQIVFCMNVNGTGTPTLQAAGLGLFAGAADIALGAGDTAILQYVGTSWKELSRSNNS